MAAQQNAVDQDRVVVDVAVVSHMRIGHQQVAVSDPGRSILLFGTAVDRDPFAKHVVVADQYPRVGVLKALVLWVTADHAVRQKPVVAADFSVARQYDMTVQAGVFIKLDPRPNETEGAHGDVGPQFRSWVDLGQW